MKSSDQNESTEATNATAYPKRAYVAPQLTELGSIEELTRGARGLSDDGQPFRFKT